MNNTLKLKKPDAAWLADFNRRHPLPTNLQGLEYATLKAKKAGWKAHETVQETRSCAASNESSNEDRANAIWAKQLEKIAREKEQTVYQQQAQPVRQVVYAQPERRDDPFVDLLIFGASCMFGWWLFKKIT